MLIDHTLGIRVLEMLAPETVRTARLLCGAPLVELPCKTGARVIWLDAELETVASARELGIAITELQSTSLVQLLQCIRDRVSARGRLGRSRATTLAHRTFRLYPTTCIISTHAHVLHEPFDSAAARRVVASMPTRCIVRTLVRRSRGTRGGS